MIDVYPPANNLDYGSNVAPAPAPTSTTTGDIWRGRRITTVVPVAGSTTLTTLGEAFSVVGTPSGTTLTSSAFGSTVRYLMTTAAAVNNHAGVNGTNIYWLGNSAGLGGFRVEAEFGVATTSTTMRWCVGLVYNGGVALPLTADPSAGTDCVFMGCDAADANMQIMHNDAAGTCTKIDLGASFPKTNSVLYRVVFRATSNASAIDYTVTRIDSAATATGTLSTNLPTNNIFMAFYCRLGNGTVIGAATGAFVRYIGEHGDTSA